ncbi:glycosyltransferase [Geodermatophilus sp. SYSU D01036]
MTAVDPGARPLHVLLFSPLAHRDPLSGDTSYTDSLLAEPPGGVTYTTYDQALKDGTLRVLGRKPWRRGPGRRDVLVFVARTVELALRRMGVMFREPVWHVSIEPGTYDVVHQHLFAVRQLGQRTPVVSSAGYPLSDLYRARDGWSAARVAVAQRLEQWLSRWWTVHTPWLHPSYGNVMTVYSEAFRDWLVDRGVSRRQVKVISTGLPQLRVPEKRGDGWTLGVIARAFTAKGGPVALEAFRLLRAVDSRWRMIVATTEANARGLTAQAGVEVIVDADRNRILADVLPRVDLLIAPTKADCGAPYAVLEALQAGTCVVTSDLPWLDDRLQPPAVHRVPPEPQAVAEAVGEVVRGGLSAAQDAARMLWAGTFSMQALGRDLREAYDEAVNRARGAQLRLLVVALPRDVADTPFDGFAVRHRALIVALAEDFDVSLLLLGEEDGPGADCVPGVTRTVRTHRPTSPGTRGARLRTALRTAVGRRVDAERELQDLVATFDADVAVTIGPWLHDEYRPVWRQLPSVHLFEEELTQMMELAPQSAQAHLLRRVEWALYSVARAQPLAVAAISPPELARASIRFPRARRRYLPFTLDPTQWPRYETAADGDVVIVVGNFAEERNAEGLVDVLDELVRRDLGDGTPVVEVVSGPGVHPSLERFLELPWVRHVRPPGPIHEVYREAWAALVPAWRVTGQKTTILQAWACGVPVVSSRQCARTVGAEEAMAVGDDAAALVDHLLQLRDRPEERRRLAAQGSATLAADFDPVVQANAFRALVRAVWRAGRGTERRRRRRARAAAANEPAQTPTKSAHRVQSP